MNLDLYRILNLPIVPQISQHEIEELSRELIMSKPYEGRCGCKHITCWDPDEKVKLPLRLLPGQAAAVRSWRSDPMGIFGAIKVGGGKSYTTILIASEEFAKDPESRIMVLLKPHLIKQFMDKDVAWARTHLNAWIPRWIVMHEKDPQTLFTLAKARPPGVYVMPYTRISAENGPAIFTAIAPTVVIADEAHTLRGKDNSGRQAFFWKWVRLNHPRGISMSGSFNRSSPKDYHRIMNWVLDDRSPLPRTVHDVQTVAKLVETAAADTTPSVAECLEIKPLVDWARREFPGRMTSWERSHRTIRKAFMLRLRSCPGVVFAGGAGCKAKINMINLDVDEPNEALQEAIKNLWENDITPDGRVVTCALEKNQVMRQLTSGFYLKRFWIEDHPCVEQAKKVAVTAKDYRSALKAFLKTALARNMNLFIPTAVGSYHRKNGAIPHELWECLYPLWRKWRREQAKIAPKDYKAAQGTELLKLDDYKIRSVKEWAKEYAHPGGVIWVWHRDLADWIHGELLQAGIKAIRKPAGEEWAYGDGSKDFVCIASQSAHGEGRNLQDHRNQCIFQWVRSQNAAEQLLGRFHRQGQLAKKLDVHLLNKLEFDHQWVDATLKDSVYDEQTFGEARKILLAKWEPLPKQYPEDFLRERGFMLAQDGSHGEEDEAIE